MTRPSGRVRSNRSSRLVSSRVRLSSASRSADVLAAVGKIAEILDIARPLCKEGVGQLEHLLEIAVPCSKSRRSVEHDHTVAHVVEGHAQLGLSITQFLEQPRILDRDHRLIGKAGGQLDLFFRERFDARSDDNEYADERVLAQQRNAEHRAIAGKLLSFAHRCIPGPAIHRECGPLDAPPRPGRPWFRGHANRDGRERIPLRPAERPRDATL